MLIRAARVELDASGAKYTLPPDADTRPPACRALQPVEPAEVPVHVERDRHFEVEAVEPKPDRVTFTESPYRRRVRMGIDDR